MEAFGQVFAKFDLDNNGSIERDEMVTFIKKLMNGDLDEEDGNRMVPGDPEANKLTNQVEQLLKNIKSNLKKDVEK